MKEMHETIQKKLQDTKWTEEQEEEFIKALRDTEIALSELSSYLYIMLNYFEQYVEAVQTSPLFAPTDAPVENDDVSSPTQTPSSPLLNRAERRSKKRVTPFQAQGIDNA
jgi:lysyl-tRNA synthetase class II